MPRPAGPRPPRCPVCRKRMSVTGTRVTDGGPVYACPYCLVVRSRGKLRLPETPVWRGDPAKVPRPRPPEDDW